MNTVSIYPFLLAFFICFLFSKYQSWMLRKGFFTVIDIIKNLDRIQKIKGERLSDLSNAEIMHEILKNINRKEFT